MGEIVRERCDKKAALVLIRRMADENLADGERARFVEVVEDQLMALHERNIARYRLRPSEFQAWLAGWQ